jgi:hypothetical protein
VIDRRITFLQDVALGLQYGHASSQNRDHSTQKAVRSTELAPRKCVRPAAGPTRAELSCRTLVTEHRCLAIVGEVGPQADSAVIARE